MTRNTLKLMACAAILALGTTSANIASAQETVNISSTLTTSRAITLTAGQALDFGTWLILDGTTDSTLVMDPSTGVVTDTAGTGATVFEITISAGEGQVTLSTPGDASVDIWGSVSTDFTDGGLSLATLTYSFDGAAGAALSAAAAGSAVSTTSGATHTIGIGGTLTVSATPADAAHTATITFNCDYT